MCFKNHSPQELFGESFDDNYFLLDESPNLFTKEQLATILEVPLHLRYFIRNLLEKDPVKRCSLNEILVHPLMIKTG